MRKIAISDIHGCNRTFNELLKKIKFNKNDVLYLLGDYIDRGPDSKGVIDTILNFSKNGFQINCLKGNHEEQILKAKKDRDAYLDWQYWGGKQTMSSFGTDDIHQIPKKYWDFFENLEYYFETDNYILAHAGLNFEMENPLEGKYSMMWIRDWYNEINYQWLENRIIIHGHTPTDTLNIQQAYLQLNEVQILNIDNGCFYKISHGRGKLCAFDMSNRLLYFQENIDDMSAFFG